MTRLITFLLLLCTPLQADTLCGAADSRVCLQSNLVIGLNGISLLQPGSAVVFHIPGVTISGDGSVSGSPDHLYRLEDHGSVSDNQGGSWATEVLQTDELGITALAYVLETGQLVQPSGLTVSELKVCQRVSDGPTEVTLAFSLIVVGGKRAQLLALGNKRMENFDACTENQGNLPVLNGSFEAYLTNVHNYPVSVEVMGNSQVLAAGEQLMLDAATVPSPHLFSSSAALPLVFFSAEDDIDIVSFPTVNHQNYVVPHVARDTVSWQNSFIFAAGEQGTIDWRQGDFQANAGFAAGAHEIEINGTSSTRQNWALVLANRGINGFFKFARRDGLSGAAWVAPVRTSTDASVATTVLYMPHIPTDKLNFWAGYSLANTSDTNLDVTMEGFDSDGLVRDEESFVLPAHGNEVGIVGSTRLLESDEIRWVRISASGGITGLQLVGGRGGTFTAISGFLLPHEQAGNLIFPLLKTENGFWSGLVVLNTSSTTSNGTVLWKDALGTTLSSENYTLSGLHRKIWMAPTGATQALFTGENLVGYCQVGEYFTGRLGAYLGIPVEP